ncbi:MAG: ski2-like helicase, partial [Candidatus Nanohaloarchaea archaeon]
IEEDEGDLAATTIGERVAELYIDPYTAHHLLQHMEQAEQRGGSDLAWLHSLSQTVEMKPRFRVRSSEEADVEEMLAEAEEELFDTPPEPWDIGYDQFLEALKTGMCLKEWVEEVDEDELMERYNVTPGGVRAKVEQADWLLYACSELATLKEWDDARGQVQKLRTRVKHGIREELLPLVRFDQVGRVRARALYDDGITSAADIRDASFNHLKNLVGKRTAEKLKHQVGQDNIFDKENILDYMDSGN